MSTRYRQSLDTQSKRINLSVTEREYDLFQQLAQKERRSLSSQILAMALAYQQQHYLIPADIRDRLDTITFILRGVGTNINQITHRINFNAKVNGEKLSVQEAVELLKSIHQGLKQLENQITQFVEAPKKAKP